MTKTIFDLVITDLQERDRIGYETYGNKLTLDLEDGRDPLQDAYEEAMDLTIYLKREIVQKARIMTLIRDLAGRATCESEPERCHMDSGPDCGAHWGVHYFEELIKEAQAILSSAEKDGRSAAA